MNYLTPDKIYGELFADLHLQSVLDDGKLITDATALYPPAEILAAYRIEKTNADFDLKAFFRKYFMVKTPGNNSFKTDVSKTAGQHIESLWDVLFRPADSPEPGSSIIPLPYPYIVPGGRFNEIYYWDSYFTMLGLRVHKRWDIMQNMIDNFSWMIEHLGFIPNGNRTYFLSRSQPPFFALMVSLLAADKGKEILRKYLPHLLKEYAFWMHGEKDLSENCSASEHVVLVNGGILNRYFDKAIGPRQEMYKDDVELLHKSNREAEKLSLDIRSACESGWDFSSRWMENSNGLATINTSDIIPVDLNCLLYNLETTIAEALKINGQNDKANSFLEKAEQRKLLIHQYCWNDASVFFHDFNFIKKIKTPVLTAAAVFPLYFKIATHEQAALVADKVAKNLLADGGILTSTNHSGQQWDAPNGWAPLQWMAVVALDNYGFQDMAKDIAKRWVSLNEKVFARTGKFMEKYNVEDLTLEAGGGEYPVQDGFGWSNGVYLALKNFYQL